MDLFSNNHIHRYLFILLVILVFFDKGLSFNFPEKKPDFLSALQKDKKPKDQQESFPPVPEISENDISVVQGSIPLEMPDLFPEEPKEIVSRGVYFIKFYGSGKQVHSRLVRVEREFRGSLKKRVWQTLRYLEMGPSEEEHKRGVLSVFSSGYKFGKKVRMKNGILSVSLDSNFEESAGADLMRDRIDQLTYSLFENSEIKAISIYIDGKKERYLGKDRIKIPDLITRSNRKYVIMN